MADEENPYLALVPVIRAGTPALVPPPPVTPPPAANEENPYLALVPKTTATQDAITSHQLETEGTTAAQHIEALNHADELDVPPAVALQNPAEMKAQVARKRQDALLATSSQFMRQWVASKPENLGAIKGDLPGMVELDAVLSLDPVIGRLAAPGAAPLPPAAAAPAGVDFATESRALRQKQDTDRDTAIVSHFIGQGADYKSAVSRLHSFKTERDSLLAQGYEPKAVHDYFAGNVLTPMGQAAASSFDFDHAAMFEQGRGNPLLANPITRGLAKGALGITQTVLGLGQWEVDTFLGGGPAGLAESTARTSAQNKSLVAAIDLNTPADRPSRWLEGAVSSILTQAPSMAAGVATGGASGVGTVLTGMWLQTFGQEYDTGKAAGLTYAENTNRAAYFAFAEVLGERFGLGPLMKGIKAAAKGVPTGQLAKFFGEALSKEIPGEEFTTALEFSYDKFAPQGLNRTARLEDYLQQAVDTLGQTVVQGGVMAGGAVAVSHVVRGGTTDLRGIQTERLHRMVADYNASTVDANKLAQMAKIAAGLKVNDPATGHPPTVESLVAHLREAGQPVPPTVYVDAEQAATYFQSKNLDPVTELGKLTGDAVAVAEAIDRGADIEIPTERFLSTVAKSEHAQAITEMGRLNADHESAAGLKARDLTKRLKEIRGETSAAEVTQAQESRAAVFDDFVIQARAIGASAAVARYYAELAAARYERRAHVDGTDAWTEYRRERIVLRGANGQVAPDSLYTPEGWAARRLAVMPAAPSGNAPDAPQPAQEAPGATQAKGVTKPPPPGPTPEQEQERATVEQIKAQTTAALAASAKLPEASPEAVAAGERILQLDDARLALPGAIDELQKMAQEAGWMQEGGHIIRTGEGANDWETAAGRGGQSGEVIGRSTWVPTAPWFGKVQAEDSSTRLPGNVDGAATARAVKRLLAGKKLGAAQARHLVGMLDAIEDARREVEGEVGAEVDMVALTVALAKAGLPFDAAAAVAMYDRGLSELPFDQMNALEQFKEGGNYGPRYYAELKKVLDENELSGRQGEAGGAAVSQDQKPAKPWRAFDIFNQSELIPGAGAELTPDELAKRAADAERAHFTLTEQLKPDSVADAENRAAQQTLFQSRSASTQAAYDARVDELFAGGPPAEHGVRVLDRSDMLDMLGLGAGPVHLVEGKLKDGEFNHGLTAADWKKVPEWLEDPAIVFDSDTQPGRLVFIAPELVNGAPVRMIVEPRPDGQGVTLLVNAYDAKKNPFERWANDGLLRYFDRNKSAPVSRSFQPRLAGLPGLKGRPKILTEKNLAAYRRQKQPPLQLQASENRGSITFEPDRVVIDLFKNRDRGTLLHELGHKWLNEMLFDVTRKGASPQLKADLDKTLVWFANHAEEATAALRRTAGALRIQIAKASTPDERAGLERQLDPITRVLQKAIVDPEYMKNVGRTFGAGITDPAERRAATTPFHEQFADGMLTYYREGNAPSVALKRTFRRFRDWLVSKYKTAEAIGSPISDEMRSVFARLLASDEQIAEAQRDNERAGLTLTNAEAKALGLDDTERAEYAAALTRSVDEARQEVDQSMLAWMQQHFDDERNGEIDRLREIVAADVDARPIYKAIEQLQGQEGPKLNREELVNRYGEDLLKDLPGPRKNRGGYVYGADGKPVDAVAQLLGYPSGDALVKALAAAPDRLAVIERETEARYQQENPDPASDGSLPERAQQALHNPTRASVLQRDLEVLAKAAGQKAPLTADLQAVAASMIERKLVGKLRPGDYYRAERRDGRKVSEAIAAQDFIGALRAKFRQALNAELYTEALAAKEGIAKIDRLLGHRLDKRSAQEGMAAGGPEFLVQIQQIRAAYSYATLSAQQRGADYKSLRAFLDTLQNNLEVTAVSQRVLEAVEGQSTRHSRSVTVGELREVYEAVRNLQHLSSIARKVRKDEQLVDRETAIEEMLDAAEQSGLKVTHLPVGDRDLDPLQKGRLSVGRALMSSLRPKNIIEMMDGGTAGPWHDYIWTAYERSKTSLGGMRRKVGDALKALRVSMPNRGGKLPGLKTLHLRNGENDFLTLQAENVDILGKLTVKRATLMAILLNTGNAGNLQRTMHGGIKYEGNAYTLNDGQIKGLWSLMTPAEADYVQGLWDAANLLWPDITGLNQRVSGIPIEKVEPVEFDATLKDGTTRRMKGGYWPLAYDSAKGKDHAGEEDAVRILMGNGITQAITPKGYSLQRLEEFTAALLLDYGAVMSRHLDHVMTDVAYRETVKHVSGLLRSARIKDALILRVGRAGYDTLRGQLAFAVSASSAGVELSATEVRFYISALLSNNGVAALALRPGIALGNWVSGLVQGLSRAGLSGMMRGLWVSNAQWPTVTKLIRENSPFMADKLDDIDSHYQQEINFLRGKRGFKAAYTRFVMAIHQAAEIHISRAVWYGTFVNQLDTTLPAGTTPEQHRAEAVRLANDAITQTQTDTRRHALSAIERDRVFESSRQFMGPMFVQFGRLYESVRGVGATRTIGKRAVGIFLTTFLSPAIYALASGRWPHDDPDDDDDEIGLHEWAIWLAANTLLFPLQMLPLLREAGNVAEAKLTGNPINARNSPVSQAAVNFAKSADSLAGNVGDWWNDDEEFDWLDATADIITDIITIASPFTGAPAGEAKLIAKSVESWQDDDEHNGLLRMMLYGPQKPTQK